MGKLLALTFLFTISSSCALLESAQDAITTSHEWGKLKGRQEVLDELAKNKKKLNRMKVVLAHKLVDLGLGEEDENEEIMRLLPEAILVAQLLRDRQDLKKHLASMPLSEPADE